MVADSNLADRALQTAMQTSLSDKEKALRDRFVQEYLIDYNPMNAALRCGFMRSFAKEYADQFMTDPYVVQQISFREVTVSPATVQNDEYTKNRILQGLIREAHYTGQGSSHSARVAALSKLAQI